jgi:hypothetical protein
MFSFPSDGSGNLGHANLTLKLKPPNGVGLSIDAGMVRSGGYLDIDTERGEYAGMLQLSILDIVSVTAIGVISTKLPDIDNGFAFVAIITYPQRIRNAFIFRYRVRSLMPRFRASLLLSSLQCASTRRR